MTTIYDVPADKNIAEIAKELKKEKIVEPPEWAVFAKTGACCERPPEQKDWWYIRSAAILRKIAMDGPVGVRTLCTIYGKKRRRGSKPPRRYPASGAVIRKILQQLESKGYISKIEKNKRRLGRVISPKGQKLLSSLAFRTSEEQ